MKIYELQTNLEELVEKNNLKGFDFSREVLVNE